MPKEYIQKKIHDILYIRNNYRRAIKFAFFLIILNLSLIVYMYYQAVTAPQQPYFVTTSDGRLMEIFDHNVQ